MTSVLPSGVTQSVQPTKNFASDLAGSEISSFPIKGTLSRTSGEALELPAPRLGEAGYIAAKEELSSKILALFYFFHKAPFSAIFLRL